MNTLVLQLVVLCLAAAFYAKATSTSDIDILKEILEDRGEINPLRMSKAVSESEDRKLNRLVNILKGYLQPIQPNRKSKRIFCNGFCGCGNCPKRSSPVGRPQRVQKPSIAEDLDLEPSKPKRLFCNSWGCGNVGKRTSFSKLIDKLRYGHDVGSEEADSLTDGLGLDEDVFGRINSS